MDDNRPCLRCLLPLRSNKCPRCGDIDLRVCEPMATWLPNDDTHAPAPEEHIDTLCTYEGPDVDPETGCLHEARQVVDGVMLCDHHAAMGHDDAPTAPWPRPAPDGLTVALEEAHAIDPEQLEAMRQRIAERLGLSGKVPR